MIRCSVLTSGTHEPGGGKPKREHALHRETHNSGSVRKGEQKDSPLSASSRWAREHPRSRSGRARVKRGRRSIARATVSGEARPAAAARLVGVGAISMIKTCVGY